MLKFIDEYRDVDVALDLTRKIKETSTRPFNIMEVCGGHTTTIRKNGINKLIGDNINLLSGPGCPVCVTSTRDVDKVIYLSKEPGVVLCTFGDMFNVPGTESSLAVEKANGSDIRVVYSVLDAMQFAKEEPNKKIIFISIGFETTTPSVAAGILSAKKEELGNFSVLSLNKTMPNALRALASGPNNIDAFICPGHVSTITGTGIYRFLVDEFNTSCCVAGFEPIDILGAIYILTDLFENGKVELVNSYIRAVREKGNEKAKYIMTEVFDESDAEWRGFGVIPGSGLAIQKEYDDFNAEKIYDIKVPPTGENEDCICGDILRGLKTPKECKLFGKRCTPANPKGACMVSTEGACSAWYKYRI